MKRVISVLAFAFLLNNGLQAQVGDSVTTTTTTTKETKTRYYYYPDANVYYNDATKSYSYYDEASKTWMTKTELPSGVTVTSTTEKVPIFYNGATVWTDNPMHQKKYRKAMKKMEKANDKMEKAKNK